MNADHIDFERLEQGLDILDYLKGRMSPMARDAFEGRLRYDASLRRDVVRMRDILERATAPTLVQRCSAVLGGVRRVIASAWPIVAAGIALLVGIILFERAHDTKLADASPLKVWGIDAVALFLLQPSLAAASILAWTRVRNRGDKVAKSLALLAWAFTLHAIAWPFDYMLHAPEALRFNIGGFVAVVILLATAVAMLVEAVDFRVRSVVTGAVIAGAVVWVTLVLCTPAWDYEWLKWLKRPVEIAYGATVVALAIMFVQHEPRRQEVELREVHEADPDNPAPKVNPFFRALGYDRSVSLVRDTLVGADGGTRPAKGLAVSIAVARQFMPWFVLAVALVLYGEAIMSRPVRLIPGEPTYLIADHLIPNFAKVIFLVCMIRFVVGVAGPLRVEAVPCAGAVLRRDDPESKWELALLEGPATFAVARQLGYEWEFASALVARAASTSLIVFRLSALNALFRLKVARAVELRIAGGQIECRPTPRGIRLRDEARRRRPIRETESSEIAEAPDATAGAMS